ncbi:MAG: hypothetical protein AAGF11_10235 [Myxococcota bacterium]
MLVDYGIDHRLLPLDHDHQRVPKPTKRKSPDHYIFGISRDEGTAAGKNANTFDDVEHLFLELGAIPFSLVLVIDDRLDVLDEHRDETAAPWASSLHESIAAEPTNILPGLELDLTGSHLLDPPYDLVAPSIAKLGLLRYVEALK